MKQQKNVPAWKTTARESAIAFVKDRTAELRERLTAKPERKYTEKEIAIAKTFSAFGCHEKVVRELVELITDTTYPESEEGREVQVESGALIWIKQHKRSSRRVLYLVSSRSEYANPVPALEDQIDGFFKKNSDAYTMVINIMSDEVF